MADTLCSSSDEEEILTYKLKIHNADITDSGKWKCEVQDKYGSVSATCDLNVYDETKRQSLTNGSAFVKNGSVEAGSDSEEEILTYRLKIHDTDLNDAGRWRCEVKDKYGTASASCNLDVYNPPPPPEQPRFLMNIRDVTTLEGQSVKLICRVRGTPLPKIVWYKDGEPISKDDYNYQVLYLKDGTISLEIFYPKPEKDATVYRCEAQNDKGTVYTEATVKVVAKQREESLPRDHYMNLSKWTRARSETRASSESHSSVRASSESRYTTSSSIRSSRRIEDYYTEGRSRTYSSDNYEVDSSYEIYKPGYNSFKFLKTDSWEPEIKLKVKWGSDKEFYFQENLKSKCILEGSRALLSCFVIGRLPLFVQWYKDGKPLLNNIYERYGIRSRAGHLSLEIPMTEIEDTGDYLVDVRNEQGRMNSSCYLQIEPRYRRTSNFEKPSFVEGIHHIHVNEGQTATFQVQVKGSPQPGIKWFKDGKRVQMTDKTTIHTGKKGTSILMIHLCTFSDMGLYKVEAHNMYGRCSGSAKLNVFESGTKLVHGENGEFKLIRRRYSFEDEETGENIDVSNIGNEGQISKVSQSEITEGTTHRESRQSINGMDEVDKTLQRKDIVRNGDNQGHLEVQTIKAIDQYSSSSKLSSISSNSLLVAEESSLKQEDILSSKTGQSLETLKVEKVTIADLQSSAAAKTENRSELLSKSKSSEASSLSEKSISSKASSGESQSKSSVSESTNLLEVSIDSTASSNKTSTGDKADLKLENSTSTDSLNLMSHRSEAICSEVKSSEIKLEEKQMFKTVEESQMKAVSAATEENSVDGVTSKLKRNESFEAIEKARKMSKGEVKLEKLYSPNGEIQTRRLSKGSSIDEGSQDKPKRKLSKGLSFEENGQNGRRLSRGSSIEGNLANRMRGKLSRDSSLEERIGKLSRKSSIDNKVNGTDKAIKAEEKTNNQKDDSNNLSSGSSNMISFKQDKKSEKDAKLKSNTVKTEVLEETSSATAQEVENLASKIVESAMESAITVSAESKLQSSEAVMENKVDSIRSSIFSKESESMNETKTSVESKLETSTAMAQSENKTVVEDNVSSMNTENKTVSKSSQQALESKKNEVKVEDTLSKKTVDEIDSSSSSAASKTTENVDKISSELINAKQSMENKAVESIGTKEKEAVEYSVIEQTCMESSLTSDKKEGKSSDDKEGQDIKSDLKSLKKASLESADKIEDCKSARSEQAKSSVLSAEEKSESSQSKLNVASKSEESLSVQKSQTALSAALSEESSVELASAQKKSLEAKSEMSMTSAADVTTLQQEVLEAKNEVCMTSSAETSSSMKTESAKVEISTPSFEVASSMSSEKQAAETSFVKSADSSAETVTTQSEKVKSQMAMESSEMASTVKMNAEEAKTELSMDSSVEMSSYNESSLEKLESRQSIEIDENALLQTKKTIAESAEAEVEAGVDMGKEEDKETIYTTRANIVKYLPKNVEIKDGEPLKLQCLVSGTPNPKVVWLHNNQKITGDFEHISLTSKAQYHNLEIPITDFKRDSGTYTLKATNISGEDLCHCEVKIEGRLEPETDVTDSSTKNRNKSATEVSSKKVEAQVDLSSENAGSGRKVASKEHTEESLTVTSVNEQEIKASSTALEESKLSATSSVSIEEKSSASLTAEVERLEETEEQGTAMVQRKKKSSKSTIERLASSTAVVDNQGIMVEAETCVETSKQECQKPVITGDANFLVALKPEYCPMERDENVRLYVKVAGDPLGPVKWFKDGEELESCRRVMVNWDIVTQESTVVFRRFKLKDAGEYECVLMTSSGTFSSKTVLNLKRLETQRVETVLPHETPDLFIPLILYPIKDTTVYKGQEAYFECAVDKQPNLTVKWYKDGKEIRQKKRKYSFKESKGVYSLSIEDVQESDCGSYTFEVADEEGIESVNASIIMKVEKNKSLEIGPPTVTERPESIIGVVEGGTIVLKCSAVGNPPPSFRWQKDMMDIIQSPRVVALVTEAGESTLTISDAEYSDRGLYVCVVRNRLGRVKVRCNLHVGDEFKKKEVNKITSIDSQSDQVEKPVEDSVSKKSTLELLSKKLDEVDVDKCKILVKTEESKSGTITVTSTAIKSEFDVNLSEEEKIQLAAEVAKKDKIEAERYIYLLMIEAEKAKKEAEEKTRIALELAKKAKEVAEKDRIEAERAVFLAEQEAELARINAEEKAKLAAVVARKDKVAAEKAMLLYMAEEEQLKNVAVGVENAETRVNLELSMTSSIATNQEIERLVENKSEQSSTAVEEIEETGANTEMYQRKKKHRMTFEEAEQLRLENETNGESKSAFNEDEIEGSVLSVKKKNKDKQSVDEAVKSKHVIEESENARFAADGSEMGRVAVEEAEKAKIAAEEAEKARMAAEESEKAKIADIEAEKTRVAAEEAEKIRTAAKEAEKARIAAEEAEKARVAAEDAEKARIAAEETEKARIAAEEAEKLNIAAEEAEKARVAAEEAEKAKITAEEAEKARIVAEEAEKARIAAEEAEKARIAAEEAEQTRVAAEEAEKAKIASEEAEKARIASEEAEKARIVAEEAEKARIAAEEAEKAKLAAKEAEEARVAAEEAENARIMAEGAEKARIAAEEAEKASIVEEAEKARLAAEEAEKAKIAAEEAEKARIVAQEAEKAKIAAEEAEKAKIAIEEAEKARVAAEEAKKARTAAEEAEKAGIAAEESENIITTEELELNKKKKKKHHRMTFEEAEKLRLEAEANQKCQSDSTENNKIAAEKAKIAKVAAEEAEKAEKTRIAAEEAVKIKIAAEEAEKARIAAESEKAKIAAEEAEKAKIAAEEAGKAKKSAEEYEKARMASLEEEVTRVTTAENYAANIAKEEEEKRKTTNEKMSVEEAKIVSSEENQKLTAETEVKAKRKKHRMTFEEAEKLRIEEEKKSSSERNSISNPSTDTRTESQTLLMSKETSTNNERQSAISISSEYRDKVDGTVESKMSVEKAECGKNVTMMASGTEQMQCAVSSIESNQQDFASNIRHQLQKQLSASGSKCQILEVSAQHVTSVSGETTEGRSTAHHHIHHPPEIIVGPDSKRVPAHSELEIIVRAKASKHAKVKWVHDGQTVNFRDGGRKSNAVSDGQQHYELITEEKPLKE